MMTGRDLVLQAMRGETLERIPWVPFCGVHSASLINTDAATFLTNADLMVAGQQEAIRRYRPDGLPVIFDLQLEAEVLGCALKWAADNPPAVCSHPLETGELTLAQLRLPTLTQGRIPLVMDVTRRLREAHPDIALYGLITGPFTLALHLLGTSIFMQMYDQPEQVLQLLDFCADVGNVMVDAFSQCGADVVAIVDPMTSQIGPDQFRQFCTAPIRKIFDYTHAQGCMGSFFVCGHAQQNIEAMCECHCDNISIDENIPLDYVRDICQEHKVSFGGNLQLTVVMLTGDVHDNQRNALDCMDIGGNTGFILAPGCDIPFATPPANIEAVAQVVHDEYARQVAREMTQAAQSVTPPFDMSEYGRTDKVIVDIITLDSEACAPCQYMVESVRQVAPQFDGIVVWREHKVKHRESIAFMSALLVHNIPTICIDGKICFVSRIPPRDELIAALQKRINQKMKLRLQRNHKVIRVYGEATDACLQVRETVQLAIKELGADVSYEEIEDSQVCLQHGVGKTPAVSVIKETIKSDGNIPELLVVKEWLKQLSE